MTTTPQTEAIRLADALQSHDDERLYREADELMHEASLELRRLDAENKELKATQYGSGRLQALRDERDQLRAQVERLQSKPAKWECFSDPSYFDMWAVKQICNSQFDDAFHVTSEVEARRLCALLNRIGQPVGKDKS